MKTEGLVPRDTGLTLGQLRRQGLEMTLTVVVAVVVRRLSRLSRRLRMPLPGMWMRYPGSLVVGIGACWMSVIWLCPLLGRVWFLAKRQCRINTSKSSAEEARPRSWSLENTRLFTDCSFLPPNSWTFWKVWHHQTRKN